MPKSHFNMDSRAVDTVKARKGKAARRRLRFRQFKALMQALEASLAAALLLSWLLDGGMSLTIDHFLGLFHLTKRPLLVFFLINCIIMVIFLLSTSGDRNQKFVVAAGFHEPIYDEYLSRRRTAPVLTEEVTEETTGNNFQIVPYVAEVKVKTTVAAKSSTLKVSSPKIVLAAVEEREKNYRRTKSALAVRPGRHQIDRELQRSMTKNRQGKITGGCGGGSPRRSVLVDSLSNEEFNRTVENYIARIRLNLQRELMADEVLPTASHDSSANMDMAARN
ncbi:hypothetical protein SAY87_003815 [Trapa incisa]|uniref:Uncharacterized protein n=1 Tax=Trapa incisa TaxID=236973 RepID=A0AAN7KPN6_9MYRT|nr:hypothetical protein SAY87_003815 [Trapa incisa]